jgi:hypothetical protein
MGSLPTAKLLENLFERNRLSALTLRDRLEKHSFDLRVGVERFVSFWKEHGHRRAFRKFGIVQLNATADDPTRSNSHKGSIPRSGRGQIATWLHVAASRMRATSLILRTFRRTPKRGLTADWRPGSDADDQAGPDLCRHSKVDEPHLTAFGAAHFSASVRSYSAKTASALATSSLSDTSG